MKSFKLLLPFLLVISVVLPVFSQEQQRTIMPDTIYVGADGKFEAEPDTAVVQFNIGVQDKKLKPAYERAQRGAEQIREILRANGIDPKDAEVASLRVTPVYDWNPNGKRKITAYRVNTGMTVKLKDFSKIPAISDSFAELDVTEDQSINYVLENIDKAKAKAVEDAMRKARTIAEIAAKAGDRQLGTLSHASVDTAIAMPLARPIPIRALAMKAEIADNPSPTEEFSAQRITITAHVNALFGLN